MSTSILSAHAQPAKIDARPTGSAERDASRRGFIGAVAFGAIVAAGVPAAAAVVPSSEIERHWQDRARAYREFEADPLVLDDEFHARPYWDRIDAAEEAILASADTSNRAVEIRLWTAWSHTDRTLAEAITQGDVATLRRRYSDFDWHERMLFTAILALRGEDRA